MTGVTPELVDRVGVDILLTAVYCLV